MAGLDIKQLQSWAPQAVPQKQLSRETGVHWLQKEITLTNPIDDKFKESFYLELSVLLAAGVDIKGTLDLLEAQQTKAQQRALVNTIRERVISGKSLSDAAQGTGRFSTYEYYSLRIGEETGKLVPVLTELAAYYNRKIKQRRQLLQALSYPIIVLCTSAGAIAFMLQFIVPMFSDVFKRFGGELPFLTRCIILFSLIVKQYAWLLPVLIIVILFFVRLNRQKAWYQQYSSNLLLRLPLIGPMLRKVYLARLCSAFALLIGARVPLLQAVGLVRQMISFYPIAHSLLRVEKEIMAGEAFHRSLSAFSLYDRKMIALLKVGEEVNKLDFFFGKLASQYHEEVEHQSAVLGSALEPVIIIVLGLIVGVILIAMYLPLFQLSTNLG